MSIIKKQGESIDFIAILKGVDGNLADLTNCTAYCGYAHPGTPDDEVTKLTPVVDIPNSRVTVSLTSEMTETMLGKYNFELKVKDSALKVGVAIDETIEIKDSLIPIFPTTP